MSEPMNVHVRRAATILLAVTCGWFAYRNVPKPLPELSRPEFLREVREGRVRKVIIEDQEVIKGVSSTLGPFRTPFRKPEDNNLAPELRARGVEVMFERSTPGLI